VSDDLRIAGSYKESGTGEPLPCVLVPHDVDNDGVPDFRQIVDGTSDDDGTADGSIANNWIPDEFEGMRLGLHAPGWSSDRRTKTNVITGAQVVRLPIALIDPADVVPPTGLDGDTELVRDAIDLDCDIIVALNDWARPDHPADTNQREIVLWINSALGSDGGHDYLPESASDRTDLLGEVAELGFLYATCIDYLQVGNESLVPGGAGEYKFRVGEIPGCSGYSSETAFGDLPAACKADAVDLVLDWHADLLEAARFGSALAGRPLRFIGSASTEKRIRNAVAEGSTSEPAETTESVIDFCNDHGAAFDLHVHYLTKGHATAAIDDLVNPPGSPPVWVDAPMLRVALEWGPMVDVNGEESTWWDTNEATYGKFFTTTDPGVTWEEFVEDWEKDSLQFGGVGLGDFGLGTMLDDDFEPAGFGIVCYGPTVMRDVTARRFNLAALWARTINEDWIVDGGEYTPLRYRFQSVAATRQVANFEPHGETCECIE